MSLPSTLSAMKSGLPLWKECPPPGMRSGEEGAGLYSRDCAKSDREPPRRTTHAYFRRQGKLVELIYLQFGKDLSHARLNRSEIPCHEPAVEKAGERLQVQASIIVLRKNDEQIVARVIARPIKHRHHKVARAPHKNLGRIKITRVPQVRVFAGSLVESSVVVVHPSGATG